MKKMRLLFAVLGIVVVGGAVYLHEATANTFCLKDELVCVSVRGPWKEVSLLNTPKSLNLVSGSFWGDENAMEIRVVEGAISSALKAQGSTELLFQKPWGRVSSINSQSPSIAAMDVGFFFKDKYYLNDQGLLVACIHAKCLDNIDGFPAPASRQ